MDQHKQHEAMATERDDNRDCEPAIEQRDDDDEEEVCVRALYSLVAEQLQYSCAQYAHAKVELFSADSVSPPVSSNSSTTNLHNTLRCVAAMLAAVYDFLLAVRLLILCT